MMRVNQVVIVAVACGLTVATLGGLTTLFFLAVYLLIGSPWVYFITR